MIEQLKELAGMQKVLDESIMKEKGIAEYPLENMKIALLVELGELMNEFPTKFKHWKSSAVDNREKGLVEYVDSIHFALSLANYGKSEFNVDYDKQYFTHPNTVCGIIYTMCNQINYGHCDAMLMALFKLGKELGFTWEEIYDAYKKKNEVNFQRLKSGY